MYDENERRGHDRGGDRGSGNYRGGKGKGLPLSELDPQLTATSHKVIGAARDVHMGIGPGFDRAVYLSALSAELSAQGISHRVNAELSVNYKGQRVGSTVADLFIAERFLVTVLAKPGEVGSYERAQLRAQLRAADVELGLIINFAGRLLKDGLVRVLNPDKLNIQRGHGGEGGEHDDHFDQPQGG